MIFDAVTFIKQLFISYYAGLYILNLSFFLLVCSCSVKHKITPAPPEKHISAAFRLSDLDKFPPNDAFPEYKLAKRLLWETRYNRWSSLFNHVSEASGSLLQGRIEPLFQIPADLAWGFRQSLQCSPRERKCLFLLNKRVRKYPPDKNSEKISRLITRLEHKKRRQLAIQEYRLGRFYLKKGILFRARFHLDNARLLDPEYKKAVRKIHQAESELAGIRRDYLASLLILEGEDFFLSENEFRDYERFLYLIVSSDSSSLDLSASSFIFSYPDSNYIDDMKYALILLESKTNDPEETMSLFRGLRKDHPDANASSVALERLNDPAFHPIVNLEKRKDAYRADLEKYLFFGSRPLDEQVYLLSGSASQSLDSSLTGIGVFFFMDIARRSLDCLFGNPVSRDEVINALCVFEAKCPDNPPIESIRQEISILYEKQKQYNRALFYAMKAETLPPGRIQKLTNKKAKAIYYALLGDSDAERKIANLGRLLDHFPDAPIAKKASKELDRLIREDFHEFRLSYKDLQSCPALWNKEILDLDSGLFDGRPENGEMSDDGVTAIRNGPVLYRLKGETIDREIILSAEIRQLIKSEIKFQLMSDAPEDARKKKKERPFPLEIAGGVGPGGWEAHPAFVPVPYLDDDIDLFR